MDIGCESHSSAFIAGPINWSIGPDDFELQGDKHVGNMGIGLAIGIRTACRIL